MDDERLIAEVYDKTYEGFKDVAKKERRLEGDWWEAANEMQW